VSKASPFIVVVDDEVSICRALKRLIMSVGFEVNTFGSGVDFLESLSLRCPDALVLDLHMPGISGYDVQARLTQAGHKLPVIVITGHDTPQSRERALDAGASVYLRKPVDEKELLDAIRSVTSSGATAG